MGVDRTDYIVYGWKLPYGYFKNKGIDVWRDDKYLPFIEGWKDEKYTLITDGMTGRYTLFGLLIAQAAEEGFEFFELTDESAQGVSKIEIVKKFKEVFGIEDADIGLPKALVFTHWS